MNIGEVVQQVQYGFPWMTVGGVLLWLIQRFVLPRLPVGAPIQGAAASASPALDWLRQVRGYVAQALALFRWVPGAEPDGMLEKLLAVLDSLIGQPGIEHRTIGEVKALVAERLKA